MPAQRNTNQSRRLTGAGLIAVTAATLLMMVWAIFPTAAFATVPWTGNGVTDGKLNNVESVTDTHTRVGSSDLPSTRRIITYENGAVVVKSLTFTHHRLL